MGEDHLKMLLTDGRVVWEAIAFQMGAIDLPRFIDVVYTPEMHHWAQEDRLQLNLLDLRPASEEI